MEGSTVAVRVTVAGTGSSFGTNVSVVRSEHTSLCFSGFTVPTLECEAEPSLVPPIYLVKQTNFC